MIQTMKDSGRSRILPLAVLCAANIVAALASGAFGAIALVDPSTLIATHVTTDLATEFYVEMYAIRALVIAVGLIAASLTMGRAPLVVSMVLAAGGAVQLGDAIIASRWGTPGVIGASIAGTVHLTSALVLVPLARRYRAGTSTN